ncbi:MAG: PQQ-binding-like beta-propeller repeat protein [Candidatus Sericytochromatia bacterium]|nr:PQQ-binding-like beta-propeller repeat protein [Candidatus Tanganyikabacteria bacterium]
MPIPPSVRPTQQPAKGPESTRPKPAVKDYPTTSDSWVGPGGQRLLLVDAIRRQVFEVNREKREVWAYRNVVPGGATYLANGNILVVDMGGNKVLEVDPKTGQPVWTFGGDADRARQLRAPRAATRLSNGNTLVVDTGNHRVVEVTAAGEIAWSYGELGRAGCAHGSLFKPQGAFRERRGNTVIADTGNHRIIEVNEGGEIVWQYGNHSNRLGGGQGSGANQLSEPAAAIRLESGGLLVADTGNQRVLEVDPMKNIQWHYRPGAAKGGTAVRDPLVVYRGAEGKTLIAGRTGAIEVDADIKILWEYHFGAGTREAMAGAWESAGVAPAPRDAGVAAPVSGAQDLPVNLPATFLIVDRVRSKLIEVDRKMNVAWQFTGLVGGERNRIEHPHYGARLANGNTLVADTGHHRVVEVRDNAIVWQFGKRGEEGSTLKHLSQPRGAERTPGGTILIADFGNRRIVEVNSAQESVWRKENLVAPVYAAKLPRGNALIVDWGAHVVMEVDERGMPVWQYGQMGNNGKGPNQLFHPEHACRLESGNTLICDTQNHRVIEVTPDKQIFWQYGGEPHLLGRKGRFGMQMLTPVVAWRLPTGRTMVHHAGANHVVEIDQELNITWHFTLAQ